MLRIRDVYPGSWFLPIPDPGSRIQKQQWKTGVKKKNCCFTFFFGAINFTKLYYFIFDMLKKKKFGPISKNYRTFYPKNCHQALKNMGLGSGIRKKAIPDPGSRGQKGTGSRIRIRQVIPRFYHSRCKWTLSSILHCKSMSSSCLTSVGTCSPYLT